MLNKLFWDFISLPPVAMLMYLVPTKTVKCLDLATDGLDGKAISLSHALRGR